MNAARILLPAGVLLALGCPGGKDAPNTAPEPSESESEAPAPERTTREEAVPRSSCLDELRLDRDRSVLAEQRSVGPRADDFAERYAAEEIDPDRYAPVKVVERYRIGDTPLLWFTPDRTRAVVDAAALSELAVADPTRMTPGDEAEVGRLTDRALGQIPDRTLVRFLLEARAIATYWHTGAELCLVSEEASGEGYRARFRGEHTYFTSTENREPLAFEVEISPDGRILVRGLPLR